MARPTTLSNAFMQVEEQDANVPGYHPYKNAKNHEKLLQYCKERIEVARMLQSSLRGRFQEIDSEFYGYLELTQEDLQRRFKQIQGKSTSPTEMRAMFIAAQMWRMVTFLSSVFSPDSGVYEVVAPKAEQKLGNALTELMNMHATKGAYFIEQQKFFLDSLKYNLAALECDWYIENGVKITDRGGKAKLEDATLFEGNKITSRDIYNTFWEPTIDPTHVHKKAEYAGYVELTTHYQLKKQVQDGEIFNTDELWTAPSSSSRQNAYYTQPPTIRNDISATTGGVVDFVNILSMGLQHTNTTTTYEQTTLYIRLIPSEFGLSPKGKANKRIEIWRIRIINGEYIIQCRKMVNAHNYIPMFFGRPIIDNLGNQSKSPVEVLSPFQMLASFMLNTHVKSVRKNLYDITIYDPQVVNLQRIQDDVAAKVPMEPGGYGKDPRASIWKPETNVDTKEQMDQITKLLELMEYIFPTRLLQNVGNIDRAIGEQIAALLAAAYRDSWKLARTLDEQALSPCRFVCVSNIKQFQTEMTLDTDAGAVEISPSTLRQTNFEFKIGEGLKMIDRLTIMSAVGDILNRLLQSQAVQGVDVLGLLTWYSGLAGNETDLTQFRLAAPQAPGTPGTPGGQQLPGAPAGPTAPTV